MRIESAPGRIVVVAPTDYRRFAFGGTLSYIQEFLAGLDEEIAKQVSLIGVDPADGGASDPVREIRERTFPFLSVCRVADERTPLRLRFAWGLLAHRSRIRALRAGLFYAHSAESALALSFVCPGTPVVLHCHGTTNTIERSRFWYGRLAPIRWAYETCVLRPAMSRSSKAVVTADSIEYERFLNRYRRCLEGRASRVGGVVDVGLFYPDDGMLRDRSSVALIAVGRVERPKGYDLLLDAVHRLVSEGVSVKLIIVGEGSDQPRLSKKAQDLGLGNRVEFTGYMNRDQLAKTMRKSDLYVSGSEQEGFSLALLEALASGLPVVATDVGGVAEVVEDGRTGYRCTSRDPVEFARLLRLAITRMDEMRAACRSAAAAYSSGSVAAQIYSELQHA